MWVCVWESGMRWFESWVQILQAAPFLAFEVDSNAASIEGWGLRWHPLGVRHVCVVYICISALLCRMMVPVAGFLMNGSKMFLQNWRLIGSASSPQCMLVVLFRLPVLGLNGCNDWLLEHETNGICHTNDGAWCNSSTQVSPPYLLRSAAGVSRAESACCEARNTEVENSYIIMSLPTASKGVHFRPYRPRDE